MKKLYTLFFSLITVVAFAQVMDVQVQDCNSNTNSIYSVLGSGKVLFVASEGLDCSTCMSKAPALQSWASQNSSGIEVWGAMTLNYSNNTPNCSDVSSWVSNYGWNNIYAFVDANEFWYLSGTPGFTVYSPEDSTIAYQGYNESLAMSTAEQLASGPSVGLEGRVEQEFYISMSSNAFSMHYLPKTLVDVQVSSLTGRVVKSLSQNVDSDILTVDISELNAGIYLVSVQNKYGFKAVKKIYLK